MIKDHANSKVNSQLVRINFPLSPEDHAQGVQAENLWAEPLGGDRFRIDNVPFYVYGISADDVVIADEQDGRLRFQEVASRGGHSTYRVLVSDPAGFESEGFRHLWERLSELGCSYEVAKRHWVTIDVPPDSDVFAAYRIFEQGAASAVWTFEEAHCGNPKVKVG
jgi:hypothetical protein